MSADRKPGAIQSIFISYRRDDCPAESRLVCNSLQSLGPSVAVFLDTDDVGPGDLWPEMAQTALKKAQTVVVVIRDFSRWLGKKRNPQRIHEPTDWVRSEIALAIREQKKVIPVFVGKHYQMISAAELPDDIKALANYQMIHIRSDYWDFDIQLLLNSVNPNPPDSISSVGEGCSHTELMQWFSHVVETSGPDDLYIASANLEIAGVMLANLKDKPARAKIQSVRIKRISDRTFAHLEAMNALEPGFRNSYDAALARIASAYPDTLECVWSGLPQFHGLLFGKHLVWGPWKVNKEGLLHARSHNHPTSSHSDLFHDLRRELQDGIWRPPGGEQTVSREIVIQSGGQTGVDRASLDFALDLGLDHTGWCPRGRAAEDGVIDEKYNLRATESDDPAVRTRTNICTSDATVILSARATITEGTLLTKEFCSDVGKPCLHLSADRFQPRAAADQLRAFILDHGVARLNVAGPRASEEPETAAYARKVLQGVWRGSIPADSESWQILGWLVPAPEDRAMLRKKIGELAIKFGTRVFLPHLTVLVGGNAEPEAVELVLRRASTWRRPLELTVEGIETSKEPRLTLYLTLAADGVFDEFRDIVSEGQKHGFMLDDQRAHLSLLYRNRGLDDSNEIAAAKQLIGDLPVSLRFASFRAVVAPRNARGVDPSQWHPAGEVKFCE